MSPPEPRYSSMVPGGDAANAGAMAFGENVPVIGPLMTRASDEVGSRLASMITGRSQEEELAAGQYRRQRDRESQPVADAAGTVAGAVGPLMSLGTTQIGGQLLGLTGSMPQRVAAGGMSGYTLAGADSLARGRPLDEARTMALTGAGIGAVSPIAERAVSPLISMITGQRASAPVRSMSRNLERDGIDPVTIQQRLDALGPEAMPLDLGPNLTRQAGAIASLPGEGQSVLRDSLARRQQGANARIQGDVNSTLGPAPIPSRAAAANAANRDALGPAYEDLFRNSAGRVDTSPIALNLDSLAVNERGAAQAAARRVREMLNVTGTGELDPSPYTLFKTRQAIDGMLGTEADTGALRVLGQTRRQIDEMLGDAVPGIKQVDARYEELARQSDAFNSGQQTLESGRTAPRPADVADAMSNTTSPSPLFVGPSGAPFMVSQGARAEIDRIIGTTSNNLTALKSALKGDGSWNRERLTSLFGQRKADDLLNILEREQTFAQSYNTVTGNSETAARAAAQQEAAPRQFGEGSTSIADILLRVPQWGANTAARGRSEAVNRRIADMLTGRPTPDLVDQLLAARQQRRGLVGSSAVPLLTGP